MKRKIIKIDTDLCNGCGLCAKACHEGAISMVDGKARLIRDDYCDGLGDCLPACPTGAISFEEREAAAYDEAAVEANKRRLTASGATFAPASGHAAGASPCSGGGCPGSRAGVITRPSAAGPASSGVPNAASSVSGEASRNGPANGGAAPETSGSELRQWPVQLKLVPIRASFFDGADLLVAADCAAFAYASFHKDFIKGKIAVIGCPKLDAVDYTEKLQAIISENDIKSLTVVRMEVPCCGGLSHAATEALRASGKFIPWRVVTISTSGEIL